MKFQHSAIGRTFLPLCLLTMAAAALAGCDRHAASQTPSPGTVESAPAASKQEPADASPDTVETPADPTTSGETAAQEPSAADSTAAAAPPSSDAPPRPAAQRPKADRSVAAGGVEKITFDDLILGMQADMVYRPWMLESETNGGRAKELAGKRVRLTGVMHGGVQAPRTRNSCCCGTRSANSVPAARPITWPRSS
jgi:hypothetical protein